MSNFEKALKRFNKVVNEGKNLALVLYCKETGADMEKVIYTEEAWADFCEWMPDQYENALKRLKK